MRTITVAVPGSEYPVWIGSGALARLRPFSRSRGLPTKVFVIADARVAKQHGDRLRAELDRLAVPQSWILVPPGESSKCVSMLDRIWRTAVRSGIDRGSLLVAFGGGVIGDLAGFAAGTILRGVDFVQIPTTLLAMVDASVGGKTGINLPEGKNLVGVFLQPCAVCMDFDFLSSLPPRELRAGWAEVVKTAAIRDPGLFAKVERNAPAVAAGQLSVRSLAEIVGRSVEIKASVVAADERESGLRMILNFGHTLAHGLEAANAYRSLLHGEAVAIGMVFAARLGEELGVTRSGVASRIDSVLAASGLPTRPRGVSAASILSAMQRDKKRGPRGLRWVLLEAIGSTSIADAVSPELVSKVLRRFLSEGATESGRLDSSGARSPSTRKGLR
jgi:3-dehydroquinate synthase